jgi:AmmeMemoRadiSam system protein A
MHWLVQLAKRSVEGYVMNREKISAPSDLPPEMSRKAGVFVCLKKKGDLRGCLGTFLPVEENVAVETISNAISAATKDPRFRPVTPEELPDLEYSVDLLSSPEKVTSPGELDPRKYGVIVVQGPRRGLLLPDLEGVDKVEDQLRIAKMKAGIRMDEEAEIFRFRVERFT